MYAEELQIKIFSWLMVLMFIIPNMLSVFFYFQYRCDKKVEVFKGGFGAEYGGRLSSVINITNNDGNRNKFEGKVSVSLLALNTTLQTPLGSFGSLSGSIRRTYIDQTLAKWIDDVPDYYFIDGNLKAFLTSVIRIS